MIMLKFPNRALFARVRQAQFELYNVVLSLRNCPYLNQRELSLLSDLEQECVYCLELTKFVEL